MALYKLAMLFCTEYTNRVYELKMNTIQPTFFTDNQCSIDGDSLLLISFFCIFSLENCLQVISA